MTHIPQGSATAAGHAALAAADPIDTASPSLDAAPRSDASTANGRAGSASPWARFALHDLHPGVRQLAQADIGHGRAWLAQNLPQSDAGPAADALTRLLHSAQQVPAGAPAQVTAPAPAVPGAPIDLARMEAMNRTVQDFNVARSPVPEAELRATQRSFEAATQALQRGDYPAAQRELADLGFPLPPLGGTQPIAQQAYVTAHMLGVRARADDGGWSVDLRYGARGNQAVNDLNGFAANARMISLMSSMPGGVSNPPTEAQATKHMRDFAQPAQGPRPGAQEIMQRAGEIVDGSIVHYSSAGARDPQYDANPNPHAFYRDRHGNVHEFDSLADARAAARAGTPPVARGGQITTMGARSPDEWADIASQGTRAGRNVGDCESKLYMQTRLLTEAGFTSLGSVDVRPRGGGIGHMFGVFQAPDGTTWVTSNEEHRQVQGSGPGGAATQADLDAVLRDMTADVYHVRPDRAGVRSTANFEFSSAATANLAGASAPTDSIRRAVELGMMRRTDALIAPPAAQP